MSNISTDVSNIYRIVPFCLLKIFQSNKVSEFAEISANTGYPGFENKQFVEQSDVPITIWHSGPHKYKINKVYDSVELIIPKNEDYIIDNVSKCSILLKQGFSWDKVFGIHILIKDLITENILISKVLPLEKFDISDNVELIDGSFWTNECFFNIIRTNNILSAAITILKYDDIEQIDQNNIGLVYNYPTELSPLITEKPIPDFIQTKIEFDDNHFISITPFTTETKTLEQSILDYFGLTIANIGIKHIIKYGVENNYKTLSLGNEDNIFGLCNIGLNLFPWNNPENQPIITVFVSTEISVNEKLMKRESSIKCDLNLVLNPFIHDLIKNPETVFPVNVDKKTVVEQKVIQTNTESKIIPITHPVFVEIISDDIVWENKNIKFPDVNVMAYLIIAKTKTTEEQQIINYSTIDGTYYFNLSEIIVPEENTTYKIVDTVFNMLIGKGNFLVK